MQKRQLGKTGLELSLIGFGGFHLVETPQAEVNKLLNRYLDYGGNYIETAAQYGNGSSEIKIGRAVAARRSEFILASKCLERHRDGALDSINRSLKNLQTDYLDIIFMHGVQTPAISEAILAPDGAVAAALTAQQQGKVRFIGITGHGAPAGLLHAVANYPYDVLMTSINYFDRFNFPEVENCLLPECQKRGIGLLGMKAVGDGYLYRSVENALRYTLSQPIASLVLGINRQCYLETDIKLAEEFKPMNDIEQQELFKTAPELGRYVCRQCGQCSNIISFNPADIFLIEGKFDRQMEDGYIADPAEQALKKQLKHWFGHREEAIAAYSGLLANGYQPRHDYRHLNQYCPYGIDIDRKLKLIHHKLGNDDFLF